MRSLAFPLHNFRHCRANGKAMTMQQILPLGIDIASGLAHMHSSGVVHCDVKPGNIMVRGDVCLVSL
jgi:serine/threonine protein kinase